MVDNIDEADYVMVLSYSSSYGEDVWFETEYYNYEEPVFQNYLDVYFFDRKAFLKSESQPEFDLKELYAVQIRMEKTYFEANTRTFKGLIDRVLYNFPRKSGYSIININQY